MGLLQGNRVGLDWVWQFVKIWLVFSMVKYGAQVLKGKEARFILLYYSKDLLNVSNKLIVIIIIIYLITLVRDVGESSENYFSLYVLDLTRPR